MSKVKIKIPKNLQRIKIIRAGEILPKPKPVPIPEPVEEIIEEVVEEIVIPEEVYVPIETEYFGGFKIPDRDVFIPISLDKLPEETIPLEEAREEMQNSYNRGFQDAKSVAESDYAEEIRRHEDWVKRFDILTEKMQTEFYKNMKDFEDSLISLAILTSTKILEREISAESDIVIDQARKAVLSLDGDKIFSMHLHPNDIDILEKVKSNLVLDSSLMKSVELIENVSVGRGGCMLETSSGTIDARIKTQLGVIEQQLSNHNETDRPSEEVVI